MAKVHLFRASFAANNACEVLGFGNIGIAVRNFFDGIAHDNLEDVNLCWSARTSAQTRKHETDPP